MISRIKAAVEAFLAPAETRSAAQWDAAGRGSRWASSPAASTNFGAIPAPEIIKSRARDSYRNNPWTRRAVNALQSGAVGAGIKPMVKLPKEVKAVFNRAFDEWSKGADLSGRRDFYGLQAEILRTLVVEGEALVRLAPAPHLRIPVQLQVLPGEFLDSSRVDSRTLNGIEYDSAGRRVAYWLFQKHPALAPQMKSIRVPADQVFHIFDPIQIGAERGVSWLASVLLALSEIQQYLEAALTKAKIANLFAAFIREGAGGDALQKSIHDQTMEPGASIKIGNDEDVTFTPVMDGGAAFEPFVRAQLRAVAAGLNVPYEILTGDLSAVTFASGRHGLIEYRRQLERIVHLILVPQALQPIWDRITLLGTALGVLPGEAADYTGVRWIAPPLEMLDPASETTAKVAKIRAGLLPRSEAVAADGWDIEDVDAEYAEDQARVDQLGLTFDSDPRRVSQQGQEQPSLKPSTVKA